MQWIKQQGSRIAIQIGGHGTSRGSIKFTCQVESIVTVSSVPNNVIGAKQIIQAFPEDFLTKKNRSISTKNSEQTVFFIFSCTNKTKWSKKINGVRANETATRWAHTGLYMVVLVTLFTVGAGVSSVRVWSGWSGRITTKV